MVLTDEEAKNFYDLWITLMKDIIDEFVLSDFILQTARICRNTTRKIPSTSVTKYLIVSLVYFSDSTWQKSSMYPGTPPVFAMHYRKNIRREPMRYLMTDVLAGSLQSDFAVNSIGV